MQTKKKEKRNIMQTINARHTCKFIFSGNIKKSNKHTKLILIYFIQLKIFIISTGNEDEKLHRDV